MREGSESMREKTTAASQMSVLMCSGQQVRVQELGLNIQASTSPLCAVRPDELERNSGPLSQTPHCDEYMIPDKHSRIAQ